MTSLPHPIGQKVVCVRADFSRTVFEWFDRVPVADGCHGLHEGKQISALSRARPR